MDTDRQSTNQESEDNQTFQDWLFNVFYLPRTIPDKWDLTELIGTQKAAANHCPSLAETRGQPESAEQTEDDNSGEG